MTTTNICVNSYKLFFIIICKLLVIGNCFNSIHLNFSNKAGPLPIDTLPPVSPLPTIPKGGCFSVYEIDLGGLSVSKISISTGFQTPYVYRIYSGGPDNLGITFYDPPSIPGFSMLGTYVQPNNRPLYGSVLMGKTDARDQSGEILKPPTDYKIQLVLFGPQNKNVYFWLPIPPDGYKAVGMLVTTSPYRPSVDRIRCVRSDFTDEAETDTWLWGVDGYNVYELRPKTRGVNAQPLGIGTIITTSDKDNTVYLSVLKNKNPTTCNPNLDQVKVLFQAYAPLIYLHPDERYHPSSVSWFFNNGALLYTKGKESNPVSINSDGSNLPQGGSSDGAYWMDLPLDGKARDKMVQGDTQTAEVYLHVKPMFGSTSTDIQVWVFYPFNGHASAKFDFIKKISLGKIGEHVGDWEHVTLRISNFDGSLQKVFFAEHNKGTWVHSSMLNYQKENRFAVFASLHGHASYYRPGLVLLGGEKDIGIRDDTWWSDNVLDTAARYVIVEGDGLGVAPPPPWLSYAREWGPKASFNFWEEVRKVSKVLVGPLKKRFNKFMNSLPPELSGEEGPSGPKSKSNWGGDEN